ncbi:class I SAM-dependent methyltransferase [Micromonospora sp. 067-2]|uniref:class I SAM-dependent methyltransferase n=1 Tax=Micromonospora sp. 067-2 TaxID=2789270 RepID=UPI003978A1B8
MYDTATFEDLLVEGASAPVDGWDFSWLQGRASEQRPSWGYLRLISARMAAARAALDIQTGGGEVLSEVPKLPPVTVATEHWPPNLRLARRTLEPRGVRVVDVAEDAPFPFPDESFDLVVSRHPNVVRWDEIARVLIPGGTYLAQQIGPGSNRELAQFFTGPRPIGDERSPERAAASARAAGLVVDELRHEALRTTFDDVAAVVYFLRKVIWAVPDFSVDRYRPRLADLHEHIRRHGPFVAHAQRVLVRAHKPQR